MVPVVLRTRCLVLILIGQVGPVGLHQVRVIVLVGSPHQTHLLLDLPLGRLSCVLGLHELHALILLNIASRLLIEHLLGIVHVVKGLRIEHVVLILILLLFARHGWLLLKKVACDCLPINVLCIAYLRISKEFTPSIGHSIIHLRRGKSAVALGRSGTLDCSLWLCT
jgi:hypothetical protein